MNVSNVIIVDFHHQSRKKITSATRARDVVKRVFSAGNYIHLPSKEVLDNYRKAIEERSVDPIFMCDDNGNDAA